MSKAILSRRVTSARRHAKVQRQSVLAKAHRLEKLLEENFPWMHSPNFVFSHGFSPPNDNP
jgi:hypothetical protein